MSTSARTIIIDDSDQSIQYQGSWFEDTGSQDEKGDNGPPFLRTQHGTAETSASASCSFSGTSITVFGTSDVDQDPKTKLSNPGWECFVDNVSIGNEDPYDFVQNNWALCNRANLTDGKHELTIKVANNTRVFWLDSIAYTPSKNLKLDTSITRIPASDPDIKFGSGWDTLPEGLRMTNTTRSTASLSFTGTSLSWFGWIPSDRPHNATIASYSIDGGQSTAFRLRGLEPAEPMQSNSLFFTTGQLQPGAHSIVVTHLGTPDSTPLTLSYVAVENGVISKARIAEPLHGWKKSPSFVAPLAGVLGAVVALLLAGLAFFFWKKRKERTRGGVYTQPTMQRSAELHDEESERFQPPVTDTAYVPEARELSRDDRYDSDYPATWNSSRSDLYVPTPLVPKKSTNGRRDPFDDPEH